MDQHTIHITVNCGTRKASYVFTIHCLVMAHNNEYFSTSVFTFTTDGS
jgi:hypothetical protein